MDLNLPGPAAFMYKGKWSAECDTTLVNCLVKLKSETQWTLNHFPSWFVLTAQRQIKQFEGVFFSESELHERVDLLHTRFKTFKAIINEKGAHWDVDNKYVRASDELWHKIIKVWFFTMKLAQLINF